MTQLTELTFVVATPLTEIELTIKEYLLAKRQEARSRDTIKQYALHLGQFTGWLDGRGVTQLSDLSRLLLREWAVSLNPDWSPATTRLTITTVKGFLNWCYAEDLITDAKLATALHPPKIKLRAQRTLTAVEIQQLLNACDYTMFGLRDAAIVSLMVDSGLRNSEVCRLKVDDLVFDFPMGDQRVNLLQVIGKGGDQKPVYFSNATADRLRAWLKVRVAKPGVEVLFVSLGGPTPLRTLTREGLYYALGDLGNRANVPGVTPHSLRRTFAVLMISGGAPTRVVQMLGRWSSLQMVERYTQALEVGGVFSQYAAMNYVRREGGAL